MILLNALYTGLVGAMGALLCYLLYLLFHYDRYLFKKYRLFLKTSDASSITWWEVILFAIINFFVIWIAIFGLFCAIFDWRTLSSESNAIIALFAGLIFVGLVLYSYRKNFRCLPFLQRFSIKQGHSQLPNVNSDIVKFNYFYSFKHLPLLVEKYTMGECSYDDVISLSAISQEHSNLAEKLKIISSSLNNTEDVELTLITIPSTGKISEVNSLLLIRKPSVHKAILYSLEYSLGDYCICTISPENHGNLGIFVSNGEQFATACVKHFLAHISEDKSENNDNATQKTDTKPNNNYTEPTFRDATPTTDIYGTPLTERLDSIYTCIQSGTEQMQTELFSLPPLSDQGKLEVEIIMASFLALSDVEEGIIIQALLKGNTQFNNVGLTKISEKIKTYTSLYKSSVLRDFAIQRWNLLEFARIHGSLKLCNRQSKDAYGNYKFPAFVKGESEILVCYFGAFADEQMTSDFIKTNKHQIVVEEHKNGDYVFKLASDIQEDYESFYEYVLYFLYCKPLQYYYSLNGGEIYDAISKIPLQESRVRIVRDLSETNQQQSITIAIDHALAEGKRMLEGIAASTGIIGKFANPESINDADDLPF